MTRRGALLAAGVAGIAALALGVAVMTFDGREDVGGRPVLVDGSAPGRAPAAVQLDDEAVVARARLLTRAQHRAARVPECLRLTGIREPVASSVLEVVGVRGRSLTFRVDGGRAIAACEASARMREARTGTWCGAAYGRLYGGRLRDGRLSMVNCLDSERRTVAFGWILPARGARWLAVRGDGATEVYRVVSDLPVRVTTTDVRVDASSAVFDVAHYAADGRRLAARRITMRVAG